MLNQLTEHEKTELTDEQVQFYIDLECATQGIQLLPDEPIAPNKPKIPFDLNYVTVGDISITSKAGKDIFDLIRNSTVYKKDYGSDEVKEIDSKDYNYPKLTEEQGISSKTYQKHKEELQEYNRLLNIYNTKYLEYTTIYEQRKTAQDFIYNELQNARDFINTKVYLNNRWERYLELADGDSDIAKKFMLHAYPDTDLIKYLSLVFKPASELIEDEKENHEL